MKLIAIYALREPDTGEIRYIGKATDAMARFKSHMRDARRRSTPVYVWINELAAAGKKPVMDVLRMVEPSQWEAAEREEIACRDRNRLLNIAAGGNQPACPIDVRRKTQKTLTQGLKARFHCFVRLPPLHLTAKEKAITIARKHLGSFPI